MRYPIITKIRNFVRNIVVMVRMIFLRSFYGMQIGKGTIVSFNSILDKTNPKGLIIGSYSYISNGAIVLAHDYINSRHTDTKIGDNVFIGSYAVIMPGIIIESNAIIAAGAIVTKNVASGTIVGGNPAKVISSGVNIGKFGKKTLTHDK